MNRRLQSQWKRAPLASTVALLALVLSGSWLGAVDCWSSHTTETTTPPPAGSNAPLSSHFIAQSLSRRSILSTAACGVLLGEAALAANPNQALAEDGEPSGTTTTTTAPFIYERKQTVLNKKELSYQISIPSSMKEGSKPVKTHLDEVNFVSDSVKRYQYGITVDPVRISSLKEFGTPEEVAARVVTAEVNRDGIFEVTLLEDPFQTTSDGTDAYILKYLSVGKRGRKVYTNKIVVSPNQLLYVLTAQCKEDDFPEQEKEIKSTVDSFQTF